MQRLYIVILACLVAWVACLPVPSVSVNIKQPFFNQIKGIINSVMQKNLQHFVIGDIANSTKVALIGTSSKI